MTYEKALEFSKSTRADGLITRAVEDYAFWDCIIEALEKQIPKKTKHSCCPNCSTRFSFITKNLGNPKGHKTIHCWNCGQAIDWSEE